MVLTPEDVHNKRFRVTRMKAGYDEEEVDAFLDEVEAELRRLLADNDQLRAQLATAEGGPATALAAPPPPPAPTAAAPEAPPAPARAEGQEAALRTLLLAQRTADDAIAEARAEAAELVRVARDQAAVLERESRDRRAAETAGLARDRQELETAIEALRGFEREYRTRLRAYLQNQLRDLEGRSVEPPGAPAVTGGGGAAPRPAGPPFSSPGATTMPGQPGGPTAGPPGSAAGAPPLGPPRQAGQQPDTDTTDVDERRDGPGAG